MGRDKEVTDTLEKSDIPDNADNMIDYLNDWLLRIRYSNWVTPIPTSIKESLNTDKYPALNKLGGPVIYLGKMPHNDNMIAVFVDDINKMFLIKKSTTQTGEISIENFQVSEISRIATMICSGSPNVLWPFYIATPIFETEEWKELANWRTEFLTTKAMHQCIGFVSGLVRSVERAKLPRPFEYNKAYPIICLLNEALKIATLKGN